MKLIRKVSSLTVLSFLVVACSSSPNNPSSHDPGIEEVGTDNGVQEDIGAMGTEGNTSSGNTSAIKSEPPQPVEEKKVVVSNSQYGRLNEVLKQQNDDQIQKISSEILTQNPKDAKALNSLAMVYYKKGRFDAAEYLLNKAIAFNPNVSELYGNLGVVQLAKNERRDGIKSFRKALELNSQDYIAGANLGSIYIQEKDYRKALMALEVPYKKGTKDPKILNNYAVALAASGKAQEAADIYARILKDNPSHREVLLNYSIVLIDELKKNKEGLDLLNRLKFVGPPSEARETIKDLENRAKAGLQ